MLLVNVLFIFAVHLCVYMQYKRGNLEILADLKFLDTP